MTAPTPDGSASAPRPQHEAGAPPDRRTIRRWQQYLADEQAEANVYRYLAARRRGEEQDILLKLADAEGRHEAHWRELLGPAADDEVRANWRTRGLGFLARHFGSVFVLALAQRAEGRSPYTDDEHATDTMAADERVHGEVVRGLAARGRSRLSGSFRAAVFGANDGLVSNLALVLGIGAAGAPAKVVLLTGLAGLLAGALSMGAGEYVSVRSQRELLHASAPDPHTATALTDLDVNANELALVYRARGMSEQQATRHAREVLAGLRSWSSGSPAGDGVDAASDDADHEVGLDVGHDPAAGTGDHPGDQAADDHEAIGTAWKAAISSFCFFASGAIIPVLPFAFGMVGIPGQIVAAVLVGIALLVTGAVVGLLSGGPPARRAARQLAIGYGAAAATYLLGLLFSG